MLPDWSSGLRRRERDLGLRLDRDLAGGDIHDSRQCVRQRALHQIGPGGKLRGIAILDLLSLIQQAYQNEGVGRLAANAAYRIPDLGWRRALQITQAHESYAFGVESKNLGQR